MNLIRVIPAKGATDLYSQSPPRLKYIAIMKRPEAYALLTIAGLDPTGGAGVIADSKTATLLGVNPLAVTSANTIQNTCGLSKCVPTDEATLAAELENLLSDITPSAIKTGMLCSSLQTRIIANALKKVPEDIPLVADPVLAPTLGKNSADDIKDLMAGLTEDIFPRASVVTPNIPECERFLSLTIRDVRDEMEACVAFTAKFGQRATLLKGGHTADSDTLIDVFFDSSTESLVQIPNRRIESRNLHGTGCVLSSAIASLLAKGYPTEESVVRGIAMLNSRIHESADKRLGHGNGPSLIL